MSAAPVFLDADAVRDRLDWRTCMDLMRQAMTGLSLGQADSLLRSFIALGDQRTFAMMPASLPEGQGFGAKLVSVYQTDQGKTHDGLVILFEREAGRPVCVADAGEVTRIRTAAMSAVATDALSRPEANTLALLGTGVQAFSHLQALRHVRDFQRVTVWGRDAARTRVIAADWSRETGLVIDPVLTAKDAVSDADVICTVTGARDPVLEGAWVRPGAHVNLVGSSGPMAAETDAALLQRSRVFPDHLPHVLAHGGEFLRAVEAGAYSADMLGPEIGLVLAGREAGRTTDQDITVFKSLGHAVQDLSAVSWLYETRGES